MKTYFAYGLGIRSYLPLAGLPEREDDAGHDVEVRRGRVERRPEELDPWGTGLWAADGEACYFRDDVGAFLVRGGSEIVVDPLESTPEQVVRLSILGPAMALVLHQRGRFVLHASTVEIDGAGVTLMGGHGWGKSTMAAALGRRGHRLVCDDITAVDLGTDPPLVCPGLPQVKLWPDAVREMAPASSGLARVHPDFDKVALPVTETFGSDPAPMRIAYVLAEGTELASEGLSGQDALEEVMRHWYGGRFGLALLHAAGLPNHFMTCAELVRRVEVRRLARPRSLEALDELAAMIERDVRARRDAGTGSG